MVLVIFPKSLFPKVTCGLLKCGLLNALKNSERNSIARFSETWKLLKAERE